MNKMEELLAMANLQNMSNLPKLSELKLSEMIHHQELEEEKKKTLCIAGTVILAVLAVAAVAFGVYKYLSKDDEYDDFEDDFDEDDFEDDFDDEDAFVDEEK